MGPFWEESLTGGHLTRRQLRQTFEECGEFIGIAATLTSSGSASNNASSLASARVNPFNQPGNGLASRDAQWSVPLLSLPGRAGLDLGLTLSYSSQVWTRSGPYVYFDQDNGWPSAGFRLGFPTIQEKAFDAQARRNVYLLVTGATRVSLRQMGNSNVYEAADSSYLQIIDYGGSLLLRTTDGTQLSYQSFNNEWHCTQIKDRNGNYISTNYNWLGQITTITDTLGRTITFNLDSNSNLISINQTWTVNGSPQTHIWASFGWSNFTPAPNFSGAMAVGASATIPVLSQVGLDDGSLYTFQYRSSGQLNRIGTMRNNIERAYIAYEYEPAVADCPRLSSSRVSAENWTGINGVPAEVVTTYSAAADGSHTLTTADGTLYKEFYAGTAGFQPDAPWAKGLVAQTETWAGGIRQKWSGTTGTKTPWAHYAQNPG